MAVKQMDNHGKPRQGPPGQTICLQLSPEVVLFACVPNLPTLQGVTGGTGTHMGIIAWLIFGLIAGAIAQLVLPGEDPGGGGFMGIVITIAVGILGAIVGGLIGAALGFGGVTGFDIGSFLIAIAGAILLLLAWRLFVRQSHAHV